MSVIKLRSVKGSPLTNAEIDANITHLNSDKSERASNLADLTNILEAKTNLGLELVSNTADADKPISTATSAALATKADAAATDAALSGLATDIDTVELGIPTLISSALATERTAERAAAATLTNKTLTNPVINGFTGTALQKSANAIGYGDGTGSGASVGQLTNKGTDVALNKPTGQITLQATSMAAGAVISFNCTTSHCDANDTVTANIQANATTTETGYLLQAFPAAGSILFTLRNLSAGALAEALVINFAVVKGSAS